MTSRDWTKEISEDLLHQQIENAKSAWIKAEKNEPRAEYAKYNRRQKLLILKLKSEVEFRFPTHLIEGLSQASHEQIANFHLSGNGDSIHWEELDINLSIPNLVAGILGTKNWMSELGRSGGKKSSLSKAVAARENGKKGGRPKKTDANIAITGAIKHSNSSEQLSYRCFDTSPRTQH